MSAPGLGRAKTSAVAQYVEISPNNCISGSQIILHTRGSMPCWRIVFSTFRGCMSFYTARVMNGLKADVRVESVPLPTPDIGALGQKVAFVPIPEVLSAKRISITLNHTQRHGRACHGHPRVAAKKDVDARDNPAHDGVIRYDRNQSRPRKHMHQAAGTLPRAAHARLTKLRGPSALPQR
jgi:hypothetical protein